MTKLTKKELYNLYKYYSNGDIRSAFEKKTVGTSATGSYYWTDSEMMHKTMGKIFKMMRRKKRNGK